MDRGCGRCHSSFFVMFNVDSEAGTTEGRTTIVWEAITEL